MTKSASTIDTGSVKAANNAYYSALSNRDLQAMEKVWSCMSDNILIAPPTNPITHVGWNAIKRNWEIYGPRFSHFTVSMTVNTININGPVASVNGIETSRRRSCTGDVSSSRNYGTNIFILQHGRLVDGVSPIDNHS
jgi:ketosteroid isomerase-like protein